MSESTINAGTERLQKLLAAAGLGSRRAIEEWIRDGRVAVNGQPAKLGDRAGPRDQVTLDGRPVSLNVAAPSGSELLVYHKPVGEMTTRSDPQGRPTVFERLPPARAGRWIAVGRLDVNTAGLLLFTTDGELAHWLMHPSSGVEREYLVRVRNVPSAATLASLRSGVLLEDGWARFDRIEAEGSSDGHAWYRVVLHEGRKRQVRRMMEAVGHRVVTLHRARFDSLTDMGLLPGQARKLSAAELDRLRKHAAV